jgi:hypothetical protein
MRTSLQYCLQGGPVITPQGAFYKSVGSFIRIDGDIYDVDDTSAIVANKR